MDFFTFTLIGLFTGAMGGWAAFAFGSKTGKVIAGSASLSAAALEADSALKGFIGYGHDSGQLVLSLCGAYVVGFIATIVLLTRMLLQQDSRYRITLIDVVFGNNRALDAYHEAKRVELEGLLERELNVGALQQESQLLDARKRALDEQGRALQLEMEEARKVLHARDELVGGQPSLSLPHGYRLPIKPVFLQLLPHYVARMCQFHRGLKQLTARFLADAPTAVNGVDLFDAYLMAVAGCIKQHLFDQHGPVVDDEVRVHFRRFDPGERLYRGHVVHGDAGRALTPLGSDSGLIALSRQTGRSLVYSVNRQAAVSTASAHWWQDYLTYVFDSIIEHGEPAYTLGISVRHAAVHSGMLYFLSFNQWEHGLQQDLSTVHRALIGRMNSCGESTA